MRDIYNSDPLVTISSNTLFHFTSNIEHIRSILEEEFRPTLSLEDLSCLEPGFKVTVPMVSFCDIPLSQTRSHMRFYGCYGIGLSKSWGQKHGINPVLYTYQGSSLIISLRECFNWTYKRYLDLKESDPDKEYLDLMDQLLRIQCYIKPYEGPFHRGNQSIPHFRFYNEREWRFVPELGEDLFRYLLDEEQYNDIPARSKANYEIHTRSRIPFEPRDIKYIIVSCNEEILQMINKIEQIKGSRYSRDEIKILNSRIIPAEQIDADF